MLGAAECADLGWVGGLRLRAAACWGLGGCWGCWLGAAGGGLGCSALLGLLAGGCWGLLGAAGGGLAEGLAGWLAALGALGSGLGLELGWDLVGLKRKLVY